MNSKEPKEYDKISIDEETEFVLDKFMEGYKLIEVKGIVKNFIEARFQEIYIAINNKDYKATYYICKKMEKVLIKGLKVFNDDPEQLTEYSKVMLYLLDINQTVSTNEKLMILKLPTDIQVYPKLENIDFYYYLLKCVIQILNNIGVIFMMRNKIKDAQSYLMRALAARSYVLESHISQFQTGLLLQNLGFIFFNINDKEDAKSFITKSILIYEQLALPQNENVEASLNYKQMLNLVEILYGQRNEQTISYPREIQKERLVHLLAISYRYYGEIFSSLKQESQSNFCQEQVTFLCNLMQKLNPRIEIKRKQPEQQKPIIDKQSAEIAKHQIEQLPKEDKNKQINNSITNRVINNQSFPPEVSEDSILFQKYIQIKGQRYKIGILQKDHYIQIIIYSKPLNILLSLTMVYVDLIEFQKKKFPQAFENQAKLEEFFTSLIPLLYVSENKLHIREIQHYQSIEEIQQKIKT